jgi:hypothetical protein
MERLMAAGGIAMLICILALPACASRTMPQRGTIPSSASTSATPTKPPQSPETIVRAIQEKLGFDINSNPPDAVEPSRNVTSGTYLVRILSATATPGARTVRFDIVSNEFVPQATKQDRMRSSWDRWIGWNKHTHPQELPVSADAVLVCGGDSFYGWEVLSLGRFSSRWDDLTPDQNYYAHIVASPGGTPEVDAIWPWIK